MKHIEANIPENMSVRVVYLHEGNCSKSKLKRIAGNNCRYITIAKLGTYDEDGKFQEAATGISRCSVNDNPCRSTGRAIAVGRALKAWTDLNRDVLEVFAA